MGDCKSKLTLLLILTLGFSTLSIPLVNASEDFWTNKAPMSTPRHGLGVSVVNGKIFAIGGAQANIINILNTTEMYDPITNTWSKKSSLPTPRSNFGIAMVNNKIYVIGGLTTGNVFSGSNQVYDPFTDSWENRASLPTPRMGIDANVIDEKIYVIGGSLNSSTLTDVNEVYDPKTNEWTISKAPIPIPVEGYASAVVDNKIYVIGGVGTNLTQIYDPKTDTWSFGAPIPTNVIGAGIGVTTGVMASKGIYVIGGFSSDSTNSNQFYDIETDIWSDVEAMPTSRLWLAVAVVDDILYAIGGASMWGDFIGMPFSINEKYVPAGYIPEFPSWFILPIFVFTTLTVIVCRKRLNKTQSKKTINRRL